jgi:hypothetical protein
MVTAFLSLTAKGESWGTEKKRCLKRLLPASGAKPRLKTLSVLQAE